MMPPLNISIVRLSSDSGVRQSALYNWRKHTKNNGLAVLKDVENAKQWSSSSMFAIFIVTAALSGAVLAEYCRKKRLLVEQIELWKLTPTLRSMKKLTKGNVKKIKSRSRKCNLSFDDRIDPWPKQLRY
jgi:hypothetical protein